MLFENTVCVPTHETALHYPKPQRAAKKILNHHAVWMVIYSLHAVPTSKPINRYLRKTSF